MTHQIRVFCMGLSLLFLQFQAKAYFEVGESAEISKPGMFKVGVMPQIRLSGGSGMNFTGYFVAPVDEEKSYRLQAGGGDTDFYASGSFKWIPIPDYKNQPAIGGKVEAIFGREGGDSLVSLRVMPLISKKFEIHHGTLIPYGAVPLSYTTFRSTTESQINLVAGAEFITPQAQNMEFGGELGLNGNKSFSYISGYVTLFLDEKTGVKRVK